MSGLEIVHAYRHILRASLRAIQFSKPARYTLVSRLRLAFRSPSSSFERAHIQNTLEFLRYARETTGLEHKILKNLLFVWSDQARGGYKKSSRKKLSKEEQEIKATAYDTMNWNLEMLNSTMGLCLPIHTVRVPN
jgi:hypothetical protein